MKLDKVANSGNDEFYTPRYAIAPLLKYVSAADHVWCPFDTADSLIVKAFSERGNRVTFSHLSTGHDFFSTDVPCDIIVSNPPYSIKTAVFERLFSLPYRFAMLVGVVGLFESQKRFHMFKENKFECMWLSRRVAYFKSYEEQKPSLNPPFSSVWLTRNVCPHGNVFEEIGR